MPLAARLISGLAKSASTKKPLGAGDDSRSSAKNPYVAGAPPTRRPGAAVHNTFGTSGDEPPPAYTPATATAPSFPPNPSNPFTNSAYNAQPAATGPSADDPYSFLSTFDTVFLIDDSGSMAGRSWRECSAALQSITPICTAHDADGVDIIFLNAPSAPYHKNITTTSTIHEIFSTVRPSGGTPTGQRLNSILKPYLQRLEHEPEGSVKPMNIIVITDGVPSDDVESVLINAAKKLDKLDAVPWQVGIQFFQVGNEENAREHLASLDDELAEMGGGCRDICDTVPMGNGGVLTADAILKCVLGAVNKRLDRRANQV